ncbi:hypothetical protein FACS1894178_1840 [Bacteroidia bacterium]|nr:hypothetical protein FACS1894178_1840 [Bacteroidia bacterium]
MWRKIMIQKILKSTTMKNIKVFMFLFLATLFLMGCKKDENGHYVTYYKNKTVTGYVYSTDSLYPIPNLLMHIEAYYGFGTGFLATKTSHVDYCYTDETGKFTFQFVKKINTQKVTGWGIGFGGEVATNYWSNSITICSSCSVKIEDIGENTILDTMHIPKPNHK